MTDLNNINDILKLLYSNVDYCIYFRCISEYVFAIIKKITNRSDTMQYSNPKIEVENLKNEMCNKNQNEM